MPEPTVATRDRILTVATDLFSEQGYEATSLREIAERLGFTKAALYYHFRSKEEILRTLLEPLLAYYRGFPDLTEGVVDLTAWADLMEGVVDWVFDHHALFGILERNRSVVHDLAEDSEEFEAHQRMHERFNALVSDASLPLDHRVRLALAIGAVGGIDDFAGSLLHSPEADEFRARTKVLVRDLLLG
jgi:AcrR family transcriptional regulator